LPRESKKNLSARASRVFDLLCEEYPDARCALDHENAFQLTVATILSAQCTDARVNAVTPALFKRFPDAAALAEAPVDELESLIRSTGFFRSKAKSLIGMARALMDRYEGEIPRVLADLVQLPGVGRKTANVVLGNAFGIDEGIVVDTHVGRLARRLRLTGEVDPEKVERDLMGLFPRDRWTLLSHLLIFHGRTICLARRPRCEICPVSSLCPSASLPDKGPKKRPDPDDARP
jgi:endonuclease-3